MIKLIRYRTAGGCTSLGALQSLTRLTALAALVSFLDTDKMTACLQPNCRISRIVDARSVLFWRDGDGDGEYAHFEGNARVIAELTRIFRMLNDNEELREALRQHLCSEVLPAMLWDSTASKAMTGDTYRMIVLMYVAGEDSMVAAVGDWLKGCDAGRKTSLIEFMQPTAKAA